MTTSIRIKFKTPEADAWLRQTRTASLLYVFENSCALVNKEGAVVSLTNPALGRGPFNLVLAMPLVFSRHLHTSSRVLALGTGLEIGPLAFDTSAAVQWDPRPAWRPLEGAALNELAALLRDWPVQPAVRPGAAAGPEDPAFLEAFALDLAGRGPGLTPAGDDFLVGWMHGAWSRFSPEEAASCCTRIVEAAVPRTTTLSAAWLKAAARGDAGEPWHRLFDAEAGGKTGRILKSARRILETGHSSGADALAGFLHFHAGHSESSNFPYN